MQNLAGKPPEMITLHCAQELQKARIPIVEMPGRMDHPEVKTPVGGGLHGWWFARNWYYWIASTKTNLIPRASAQAFHERFGAELKVRVDGHCAEPTPADWWGRHDMDDDADHYHIDTQEGLTAFATFLRVSHPWDRFVVSDEQRGHAQMLMDQSFYKVHGKACHIAQWPSLLSPRQAMDMQINLWDEKDRTVLLGDYLREGALADLFLGKTAGVKLDRNTFKAFVELGGNTFDKANYGPATDYKEADDA